MTAICSVGSDVIAILLIHQILHMITMKWLMVLLTRKTTAVPIIPYGKEGDMLELEVFLGMRRTKVSKASSADFIARGGQNPALFTV